MNLGPITAFLHASLIGKLIWLLLIAAGVVALAFFLKKRKDFQMAKAEDWRLKDILSKANYSPDIDLSSKSYQRGSFFLMIYTWQQSLPSETPPENLKDLLKSAAEESLHQLESGLSWVASIASNAPFVGLLGTVVGIIKAFEVIGATGNTSLQSLGPAIAEALYATGVGLFVAIVATFFYNHLLDQIKDFEVGLGSLESQLITASQISNDPEQ